MTRLSLLPAALLGMACSGSPEPSQPLDGPRKLTLAWQANVNGDIEPCG